MDRTASLPSQPRFHQATNDRVDAPAQDPTFEPTTRNSGPVEVFAPTHRSSHAKSATTVERASEDYLMCLGLRIRTVLLHSWPESCRVGRQSCRAPLPAIPSFDVVDPL